jgi:hypothetical protein
MLSFLFVLFKGVTYFNYAGYTRSITHTAMSAEWRVSVVKLVECTDTQFAHLSLVASQQTADKVLA